jgi:hypothetical protein
MADPAINGTNADADIETGGAEPSPRQKRFFPDWPGIGSHLRYCWIDIAIFLLLVAAALALFLKPPDLARQIKFAVDSTTGSALWPDIAYPKQKEIVNTVVSAVIATTVPIVVIVGISVGFIRSYRSLEAAVSTILAVPFFTPNPISSLSHSAHRSTPNHPLASS